MSHLVLDPKTTAELKLAFAHDKPHAVIQIVRNVRNAGGRVGSVKPMDCQHAEDLSGDPADGFRIPAQYVQDRAPVLLEACRLRSEGGKLKALPHSGTEWAFIYVWRVEIKPTSGGHLDGMKA